VNIVAATGYHRDAHYPDGHWVLTAPDYMLLGRMKLDLNVGMHPADWSDPDVPSDSARAGVIKAGASLNEVTDNERRRLIAAAAAAREGGVAVVAHCEAATMGEAICDLLLDEGLAAGQIILAHMDRDPDPGRHGELLARGIFLVYDTIGRKQYHPDSVRLDLIEAVCTAGRAGQILLGLDLGKRSYLRVAGGHGLRYLMEGFVPALRERVGEPAVQAMLIDNAAAAFALRFPLAA
jgi:phosphotriesterase-related protein